MGNNNKKEKGMVLVTVIILGAIIIMLATAMLSTGVMEVKSGNHYENDTQAYYTAKAGADILAQKIMDKEILISSYPATFTGSIDSEDTYIVVVTKTGNQITLDSTGTKKGVKDTVQLILNENVVNSSGEYTLETDMAVFASEAIILGKSVTIEGDIGTNSTDIIANEESVNGTIFYDLSIEYPDPLIPLLPELPYASDDNAVGINGGSLNVNKPTTYNITEDVQFDDFNISDNLTIDVGNANRTIKVKNLNVSGNLLIAGSGNLILHVENSIRVNKEVDINTPSSNYEKLQVYYHGTSTINISTSLSFCGILQLKSASIYFNKDCNFIGILIGGSEVISMKKMGDSSIVVYAPKALVTVDKEAEINGNIIAKKFTIDKEGIITYKNTFGNIIIPVEGGSASVTYEKLYYQ